MISDNSNQHHDKPTGDIKSYSRNGLNIAPSKSRRGTKFFHSITPMKCQKYLPYHTEIQPNKKTSEFMSLLEESRLEFTKQ